MRITLPELSLVVLIGPSGSGKSSFARAHFKPTEVLSSDYCRGLVSDDENDQAATNAAFEVLHFIAARRLAGAKLTVVDATNVQEESRKPLVALRRSITACRTPSFSICPRRSAPNVIGAARMGIPAKAEQRHPEFALGMEGLKRFVSREPLRRVHECVFGVLALESGTGGPETASGRAFYKDGHPTAAGVRRHSESFPLRLEGSAGLVGASKRKGG